MATWAVTLDTRTSYIRSVFVSNALTPVANNHPDTVTQERGEHFDKWLEAVIAKAKREAREEMARNQCAYWVDVVKENIGDD